jgi:hypothetical protein
MNRFCIALAAAALLAGCQDNSSDKTSKSSTPSSASNNSTATKGDSMTAKSTAAPAAPIEYQEVRVGNNVYVVGSKAAAEKAKAGKLDKPVRAIGYGAPGDKVYFDEADQAALEAEYKKRHPGQ